MNLFSLIFALLLALAFIVFLLLFIEAERRRRPAPAPDAPVHAAELSLVSGVPVMPALEPLPSIVDYHCLNVSA